MPDLRAGQASIELPFELTSIKRVLVQRRGQRPYALLLSPLGNSSEPGLPTHARVIPGSPKILHLSPTPNEDCKLIVEYSVEKVF